MGLGFILAVLAVLLTMADTLWFGPRLAPPNGGSGATGVGAYRILAILAATLASVPAIGMTLLLARRTGIRPPGLVAGWLAMVVVLAVEAGRAHGMAETLVGPPAPDRLDVAFVVWGPLIEEAEKVVAILIGARILRIALDVRAGIVLGLAVGIGFTSSEIGLYSVLGLADGQADPMSMALASRIAFGGFGLHAATAALLGAALGPPAKVGAAFALIAGAVATHVVWNLAGPTAYQATRDVLVRATGSDAPHVFWAASLPVAGILIAPASVALLASWRRGASASDG